MTDDNKKAYTSEELVLKPENCELSQQGRNDLEEAIMNEDMLVLLGNIRGYVMGIEDCVYFKEYMDAFNYTKSLKILVNSLKRLLVAKTGRQAFMVGIGKVAEESDEE